MWKKSKGAIDKRFWVMAKPGGRLSHPPLWHTMTEEERWGVLVLKVKRIGERAGRWALRRDQRWRVQKVGEQRRHKWNTSAWQSHRGWHESSKTPWEFTVNFVQSTFQTCWCISKQSLSAVLCQGVRLVFSTATFSISSFIYVWRPRMWSATPILAEECLSIY